MSFVRDGVQNFGGYTILGILLLAILVFVAAPPSLRLIYIPSWILIMLLIAAVVVFVRELYLVIVTQRSFKRAVTIALLPILFTVLLALYQGIFLPWVMMQSQTFYLNASYLSGKLRAVVRRSIKSPLNLRDAPGGRVVSSLPPGTQVAFLSYEVKFASGVPWVRVRVIGGPSGWVSLCYLDLE